VPTAVEEVLRWGSSLLHFRRTAGRDVELHGETIRENDKVLLWYISANRDETQFPDPLRFDVGRVPNKHVAFGLGGPHFCLGAHLARLELRVFLEELLPHLPHLELAGEPERLRSNFFHGIKRMPVVYRRP
jgi:cytochrome P450